MTAPKKMSRKTVEVLFSGNQADTSVGLGHLMNLQRQIMTALDGTTEECRDDDLTGLRIAAVGRLLSKPFVEPPWPELVWDDCVLDWHA